jgi:hypothetical protein
MFKKLQQNIHFLFCSNDYFLRKVMIYFQEYIDKNLNYLKIKLMKIFMKASKVITMLTE